MGSSQEKSVACDGFPQGSVKLWRLPYDGLHLIGSIGIFPRQPCFKVIAEGVVISKLVSIWTESTILHHHKYLIFN